jgi:hypothetical protein
VPDLLNVPKFADPAAAEKLPGETVEAGRCVLQRERERERETTIYVIRAKRERERESSETDAGGSNLDAVLENLQKNFAEGIGYFQLLVKARPHHPTLVSMLLSYGLLIQMGA